MRENRRPLIAALLVLLHVLAPGLHWLQHAVASSRAGQEFGASCGHACCAARVDVEQVREPRTTDQPAFERAGGSHDHDCELCSQLHRFHGYVAPSTSIEAAEARAVLAEVVVAPKACAVARVALPPSRAPPSHWV